MNLSNQVAVEGLVIAVDIVLDRRHVQAQDLSTSCLLVVSGPKRGISNIPTLYC